MLRSTMVAALVVAVCSAAQPETIDLRVEKQPLFTLIERIARQCDAGLAIHHTVQDRLEQEVTINARDARWADALELLRAQYRLAVRLDGDRLLVEDAEVAQRRRLVAVRYDIRALRQTKQDRPGPTLQIPEPGGSGSMLLPPIESGPAHEAMAFIDLIRQRISPASWQGQGAAIEERSGELVVVQSPEVQQQIAAFLIELEAALLRQVQIRVWRLDPQATGQEAILDRAGLAARIAGMGAPALAFVTGDGQQGHMWSGTQRMVVSDADVVQGALDPIMSTLASGLAIDVKPLVTRAGLRLTIRLDAADLVEPEVMPMRDGAGLAMMDVIQPGQDGDSTRLTVVIPDGGAAILRFADRAYAVQAEIFPGSLPAP